MKRELLITADGSHTLYVPELNEHYHSINGAVQESLHVFINAGLNFVSKDFIKILEVGFGTGLNALLSLIEAEKQNKKIYYESIEPYPIEPEIWQNLNYATKSADYFVSLHTAEWNKEMKITEHFTLKKLNVLLNDYQTLQKFDLIYFDAFAPDIQPELWSKAVFDKMYNSLNVGGVLVTYSSKGLVKQNLRDAGFTVTRLKGAGGKRHMVRAVK